MDRNKKLNEPGWDIIGDVHGHADQLELLLQKMGYTLKSGVYTPPKNRTAFFVGDFIDRGPKIRETLHIVKNMCDAGYANAVMGNHEYNAICFHTPHKEIGGFFRNHSLKEIEQHIETLRQFKKFPREWELFLDWFKSIPMVYENENFRVVHAYWDSGHVDFLNRNYKGMTSEFLSKSTDKKKKSKQYKAVEDLLKGTEETLDNGVSFFDKDGTERHECRVRWWRPSEKRKTLDDYYMECPETIKNERIDADKKTAYIYVDDKIVFFGHYWLKGIPEIENKKAVCLDYSVAKGGKLVAYRWSGEKELRKENLVW